MNALKRSDADDYDTALRAGFAFPANGPFAVSKGITIRQGQLKRGAVPFTLFLFSSPDLFNDPRVEHVDTPFLMACNIVAPKSRSDDF